MQTRLNHSIQHTDPTDHPDLVRYCYTDGSIPPARAKITNGLREALTNLRKKKAILSVNRNGSPP
jgi:hypothetical protein